MQYAAHSPRFSTTKAAECKGNQVIALGSGSMVMQSYFAAAEKRRAGYLRSECAVDGFQPRAFSINAAECPIAIGGRGQASTFTTISRYWLQL